jgi:hypothetical protein
LDFFSGTAAVLLGSGFSTAQFEDEVAAVAGHARAWSTERDLRIVAFDECEIAGTDELIIQVRGIMQVSTEPGRIQSELAPVS